MQKSSRRNRQTTAVILHNQKLVYVVTEKVASTTLYYAMLQTAGMEETSQNPRRWLRSAAARKRVRDSGVDIRKIDPQEISRLRVELADYFWFCAKRDPFRRVISGYKDKIHKTIRNGDFATYLLAEARGFGASFVSSKNRRDCRLDALHRSVDLARFMVLIERLGVGFDVHFEQQVRITRFGEVDYDFVVSVEDFDKDIETLHQILAGRSIDLKVPEVRLNQARLPSRPITLPEDFREKVVELYAPDFEAFDYDPEARIRL
ncbi:sulfotransferase family 2 domain-containing protein [Oricola sp.]|uniref:sulfotransferase family 2 domain-containing protein n=1 Tax=Oricola sp. TaxID=1979950 RepID=UPI003BAC7F56